MAKTAAQRARAVRQEALRDYLANRGKLDYVFDLIDKIEELEPQEALAEGSDGKVYLVDLAEFNLKKYAKAAELRIKMVHKYLGDEKTVETIINDVRNRAEDLTDDELTAIIASRGSDGTAEAENGAETSPSLH